MKWLECAAARLVLCACVGCGRVPCLSFPFLFFFGRERTDKGDGFFFNERTDMGRVLDLNRLDRRTAGAGRSSARLSGAGKVEPARNDTRRSRGII